MISDYVRLRGEEARCEDIRAQEAGTTRSSIVSFLPGIGARDETRLLDEDSGVTKAAAPSSKRESGAISRISRHILRKMPDVAETRGKAEEN